MKADGNPLPRPTHRCRWLGPLRTPRCRCHGCRQLLVSSQLLRGGLLGCSLLSCRPLLLRLLRLPLRVLLQHLCGGLHSRLHGGLLLRLLLRTLRLLCLARRSRRLLQQLPCLEAQRRLLLRLQLDRLPRLAVRAGVHLVQQQLVQKGSWDCSRQRRKVLVGNRARQPQPQR